jgi:hypothetical protein
MNILTIGLYLDVGVEQNALVHYLKLSLSTNIMTVMSFLMGLNESFIHVRGQILLMEPLPSINKVFSMIQADKKQRGAGILPLSFH